MQPLRAQLAEGLRRLRAESGLSLQQVSDRVGLSRPALNFMERGKSGDFLDSVEKFASACGGGLRLVVYGRHEAARAELAQLVAALPVEQLQHLVRLVRVWGALPPLEQRLMADAAELRAAAQAPPAQVLPLAR